MFWKTNLTRREEMPDTIEKDAVKKFAKDCNEKMAKIEDLAAGDMEAEDALDRINTIASQATGYIKAFMEFHGLD